MGDEHHRDDQWVEHVVPISLEPGESLPLGWENISDQGLTMGGWNIDDVCVYAVGDFTPSNPEDVGSEENESDQVGFRRGDTWVLAGEKVGCSCAQGVWSDRAGWIGVLLSVLLAAIRRRER